MKSLGKKKAEELEAKAPGITLSGWLEKNYTHVTLDENIQSQGKILRVPKHNVELTIGLLSTDNIKDWSHLAFHWAPAGTIIDRVPENIYDQSILLLRQLLTKKLLQEPDNKTAKRYMEILERRDPTRWAQKSKGMHIKASATNDDVKSEGGESGSKKVVFDFDIV